MASADARPRPALDSWSTANCRPFGLRRPAVRAWRRQCKWNTGSLRRHGSSNAALAGPLNLQLSSQDQASTLSGEGPVTGAIVPRQGLGRCLKIAVDVDEGEWGCELWLFSVSRACGRFSGLGLGLMQPLPAGAEA